MTTDRSRRSSTAPFVASSAQQVPPAPPLPPPPRYTQQAKNALHRVFGFGVRIPGQEDGVPRSKHHLPNLSFSNAGASHRTGLEINSLSINEQGTHALLAGKHIFKTIRVEEGNCTEDANIRAAIRTYDASTAKNTSANSQPKDILDIHDVAWAKGTTGNFVAAATYNGAIILYDLNRLGIEVARLFDHRRQVHRVTFNPHSGHHMLSAGQDGTVRLWDIRDYQRNVGTFTSRWSIVNQNNGIRDVKWSPTNGVEFALGTDGGWIQKWDTRMNRSAKMKIAAHSAMCNTIDWHPDGKHLLSASADRSVRIWNLDAEGRRQKPAYEIKTPFPLRNARWRPPCQSSMVGDGGASQCTQIVTSYDKDYPMVHIWDMRRPMLPFRELECYQTSPTDLLWHSQDLLWTVGREGAFLQSDVKYAPKVMDKRNMQAFALSPLGEINEFIQKRYAKRRPPPPPETPKTLSRHSTISSGGREQRGPEITGRGSADDSLDNTFLSAQFKHSGRRSARPKDKSLAGTPRSNEQSFDGMLKLDGILNKRRSFRPGQSAARGFLPGGPNASLTEYLASKYKIRSHAQPPAVDDLLNIHEVFDQNARYAELASLYRMAQTWRIIGRTLSKELQTRAEKHRKERLQVRGARKEPAVTDSPILQKARKMIATQKEQGSKPATPLARPHGLTIAQADSTSNVPTPLAGPARSLISHDTSGTDRTLPDLGPESHLALPPSMTFPDHTASAIEDDGIAVDNNAYSQNPDAKLALLREWHANPKNSSLPESSIEQGLHFPPQLMKHDSDESFGVFPSMSTSRVPSLPDSLTSSKSELMEMVRRNLLVPEDDEDTVGGDDLPCLKDGTVRGKTSQSDLPRQQSVLSDMSVESPPYMRSIISDLASSKTQIARSPQEIPSRGNAHNMSVLARNNQESFSSESEMLSESRDSAEDSHIPIEHLEASGTIVPDTKANCDRSREPSDLKRPTFDFGGKAAKPAIDLDNLTKDDFIPSDFLLTTATDSAPHSSSPFSITKMLLELLGYHTTAQPDAQTASVLILLLSSLLPETSPLPQEVTDATVAHYLEHLSTLSLPEPTILTILSTQISHLLSSGLSPLHLESILETYHTQLQSLSLFNNAAYLRRLTYPTFPSVYEQGLKDTQIRLRCGGCKKPMNNINGSLKCEHCRRPQRGCPVCWCKTSPFEEGFRRKKKAGPPRNAQSGGDGDDAKHAQEEDRHGGRRERAILYSTCLLCNHSAHAACLAMWHGQDASKAGAADSLMASDGACPTEGCLCDCLGAGAGGYEGIWRDGVRARKTLVRDDDVPVGESRAVAAVRRSLAGGEGRPRGSWESSR